MRRLFLILILFSFSLFFRSEAQVPTYTHDECIELALKNNNLIKTSERAVESSVMMRREAFTKYFPEISAIGLAFWANHDVLQYNLLDLLELGIIKNGKSAGIQALQPVFMGGQIVNGNKLAAVGEEVARIRAVQTQNDVRLTTETLFWKLATLKATESALETAVQTLDTLERQVNVAVDAGLVSRNELLKVRLKRNSYWSELVDLKDGIKLVSMLLGQYMGLGTDGNLDIISSVPMSVPEFPYEIYVPAEDAVKSTVDYNLLDKNVEAKRLEKRMELGRNLPTVAVGAGWYYHDLLGQSHNFGAVQIGVSIPITGWWSGAYAMKRKSIALADAESQRSDLGQKLVVNIQDKWNNLTSAHRKMEIEAEGIGQSEENYRLSSLYYEAGMNTIGDLLEAEAEVKEAHVRYISAYGAFCTARASYLIVTGR